MKRILFTVTNDLNYDQRMIRICSSLQKAGYDVTLVGRLRKKSVTLNKHSFRQRRLFCFFDKGKLFYIEYNLRLFFFLLFCKADCFCAIDLDTILPVYFITKIRNKKRVYDAHELFCEMKEVVSRPPIYKIWKRIERFTVPEFKNMYTVNQVYADEFKRMYGNDVTVIRNVPLKSDITVTEKKEQYILYQGAVNEGRCFESLIPAMKEVSIPLKIFGTGNFLQQAKELVKQHSLEQKIFFMDEFLPEELRKLTPSASIGITLFEKDSLSNYYSLANRFFDYINAGVPQLCVDYPAYRGINKKYKVAVLISDLSSSGIATALNRMINTPELLNELNRNCIEAAKELNWENEEKKLIEFYHKLM